MADLEVELKSLKEKNNELVQKVQYWKMTAAQRENEKLELMKEINQLRLKVIRLKSGGAAEARKLDVALQSASEEALSHLVQASSAVARTMELAKTYMRDREGVDTATPRWSSISNSTEKVHRVPPMMGGQSIQPVVSLSRTMLNISGNRQPSISPNSSRNVTVRAVPMHMLQDVYIPLTRIDMRSVRNNSEAEPEPALDDSGDNIPFDESMEEPLEESQNMTDDDEYESSRQLDVVAEDVEPEGEDLTPPRTRIENPLEGPSWLLDRGRASTGGARRAEGRTLEPDSTTEDINTPPARASTLESPAPAEPARVFTPTVRRRKRASTPPRRTREPVLQHTNDGLAQTSRVLQVLVPKMRLGAYASPPKRRASPPRFDAPSPNGATDSRVIVSEELENQAIEDRTAAMDISDEIPNSHDTPQASYSRDTPQAGYSRDNSHDDDRNHRTDDADINRRDNDDSPNNSRRRRHMSRDTVRDTRDTRPARDTALDTRPARDSGDSDSGSGAERVSEGRTRRNRKPVTYKEKPLNRKLRR